MRMIRADILQDTNFAPAVFSVVCADDDEVVTRVKGYIGKLFVFFHVLFKVFISANTKTVCMSTMKL